MDERFKTALDHFEKSQASLNEVLAMNETDVVRDAIIKRFEYTFETAWQACYRWLAAQGVEVDKEAFAVLPRAFNNRLITNEELWRDIRRARNKTSHTYNENTAIEVAALARTVAAPEFARLIETLKARAEE